MRCRVCREAPDCLEDVLCEQVPVAPSTVIGLDSALQRLTNASDPRARYYAAVEVTALMLKLCQQAYDELDAHDAELRAEMAK